MILPFLSPKLRMTGISIQFAAKAVLMNGQKNLMSFSFTIFPSNLKKKTQIKIFAFLNNFSIQSRLEIFGELPSTNQFEE